MAHDTEVTEIRNYDFLQKKVINIDDVLSDDRAFANVMNMCLQEIKRQHSIEEVDMLETESEIVSKAAALLQNFYFNDSGFVFLFNPYSILSYSHGTLEVNIPYVRMDKFVNDNFKDRLKNHA